MQKVSEVLVRAGIPCAPSPGTFFLYVAVPEEFRGKAFSSAQEFTDYLLVNFGLVTVPWDEAGPHIRLSMTFEVGTEEFPTEDSVVGTLAKRMGL
jgi:LL-diaminopimelate aminotransferase